MLRLTLLLPLVFSLSYRAGFALHLGGGWSARLAISLGVLVALVLGTRVLAARIAARSGEEEIEASAARLGQVTDWARAAALLWCGAGVYLFGWRELVPAEIVVWSPTAAVALLCGLPSYLTWGALYWAQFPAERAVREQAMLAQLNAGIPLRGAVGLWTYLDNHVRSGLGVVVLPALAALGVRDAMWIAVRQTPWAGSDWVGLATFLVPSAAVFLFAPVFLTRVFRTRRLPEGVLRARLAGMAHRAGVGYADVLVWDTHAGAANALVMGLVPRLRYVLLSDLLIETMTDEEIEAVFAHELGHLVHRHVAWYGAFLVSGALVLGWLDWPREWADAHGRGGGMFDRGWEAGSALATIALLLWGFGHLSRRFEGQADVYAARALGPAEAPLAGAVMPGPAALFAGALQRVAMVNNMPVTAHSWSHGSIAGRVHTIRRMGERAQLTAAFDEKMMWIRIGIGVLIVGGIATGAVLGFS